MALVLVRSGGSGPCGQGRGQLRGQPPTAGHGPPGYDGRSVRTGMPGPLGGAGRRHDTLPAGGRPASRSSGRAGLRRGVPAKERGNRCRARASAAVRPPAVPRIPVRTRPPRPRRTCPGGGPRLHPVLLPPARDRLARAVRRDVRVWRRGASSGAWTTSASRHSASASPCASMARLAALAQRVVAEERAPHRRPGGPAAVPDGPTAVALGDRRRCAGALRADGPRPASPGARRGRAGSGADAPPGELGLDLALGLDVAVDLHPQLVRLRQYRWTCCWRM